MDVTRAAPRRVETVVSPCHGSGARDCILEPWVHSEGHSKARTPDFLSPGPQFLCSLQDNGRDKSWCVKMVSIESCEVIKFYSVLTLNGQWVDSGLSFKALGGE